MRIRTVIGVALSALIAVLVVGEVPAAAAVAGRAVKVMPLGDSITYGTGSSTTSSYRAGLWQRLTGYAGLDVDFVGSQQTGALPDTDNEGHPGWRIDQIAAQIDGWLSAYTPDVVLVHLGTNDTAQNFDLANAPARLGALIDQIGADAPGAAVLVAQIVPSTDATVNARIAAFNAQIPALVAARSSAGENVRYVDLNSPLTATDMSDSLHPNDGGYDKMAAVWYAALDGVLGGGRDWPVFRSGLETGEAAPTWTDTVDFSANVGGYLSSLTHMESGVRDETPRGAANSLMYSGTDLSATQSYSYNKVFDVHLPLAADSVLSYWIYPQQATGTYVAIDLLFTDGSSLRDSGLTDQYGVRAHPRFQGEGGHLAVNRWNLVKVNLGALAGRTVDRIDLGYDQPAGTGQYRGYVDDIAVVNSTRQAAGTGAVADLALKHPVTADAPCTGAETADKVDDGTVGGNSKWCSGVPGAGWQVDLGAATPVGTVVVRHASAGGEGFGYNTRDFRLLTSLDGSTWQTFATVTGNVEGVTTSTRAAVPARYVRFVADNPTQNVDGATRIYEVEVYAA